MLNAGSVPEWHLDAACAEHEDHADDWFPLPGQSSKAAVKVCERCLVQRECLAFALDEGPQLLGIWGGASGRDRKRLLDGNVTGDLIRHWGMNAVEGRRIERYDEYRREQEAEINAKYDQSNWLATG